jgi:hypothetical protein
MLDADTSSLDELRYRSAARLVVARIKKRNTTVEIMQNLQISNSFGSIEITGIFLFETRFKK